MSAWFPIVAASRITLVAVRAGIGPWTPAVPFLADSPAPDSNVASAAFQTVLGYGVIGVLVLALAYIVWKGSFTPSKRVDELVAAGRVDLLRENEQLRDELTRAQAQIAENLRFAKDDLVPILSQFTAATTSLLPILQQVGFLLPVLQQAIYRQQPDQPPRRDLP